MSNAVPFTVEALRLASISPSSGVAGTQVTFTGTMFGASPGVVWLGSTAAGSVVSWSDTQVVATVGAGAVSGIAAIQQNGVWSNAVGFTVPVVAGAGPRARLIPELGYFPAMLAPAAASSPHWKGASPERSRKRR